MNILFVIPALKGGGAETQMRNLANIIAQEHHVFIAYIHTPDKELSFHGNIKLIKLSTGSNYSPKLLFQLLRIIKFQNIDTVQTFITQSDILIGIIKLFQMSFQWVLRESSNKAARKDNWKLKLRKYLAKNADAIVANSKNGLAYWNNINHVRKKVIRNGYCLSIYESSPLPQIDSTINFIYIGRLIKSKNIDGVIKALKHVNRRVKFFIVGDGIEKNNLKQLSNQLNIDCEFKGYLTNAELNELCNKCHFLIFQSRQEGMPNVLIETALRKRPMIISKIPAHQEIFNDKMVFYSNSDSEFEIAKSINTAINCPQDKLSSMIDLAYKKSSTFSLESMAKSYIELYNLIKNQS